MGIAGAAVLGGIVAVARIAAPPAKLLAHLKRASRRGVEMGLGLAITTIPAAAAARRPFVESSTAAASTGSTPSRCVAARYQDQFTDDCA
jgi:hypothetical protein